jgi:hypothetical protein
LRWKKGRGIYSPSQNVAVAASGGGLSGQSRGGLSGWPDNLAWNEISGTIIWPDFWVTLS